MLSPDGGVCSERNGVLYFDYLFMGESFGDSKYILVLKDHASYYCELGVADTADSAMAVGALLEWHTRFGLPPVWISDQGSHFKNEVVSELSRRLRTKQQLIFRLLPLDQQLRREREPGYPPSDQDTMILEYKIHYHDWFDVVPMVRSSINHTAVPSLDNRAPVELFIVLPCPKPLREFYRSDTGELQEIPDSDNVDQFLTDLRGSIQDMHKVVQDQRLKKTLLNEKRGGNVDGNELLVTWIGPYRVVRADAHSFPIRHLITGVDLDVHALGWLKFYANSSLDVTEGILEHISSQVVVLAVEKLKEHRWNSGFNDFEMLVRWKNLESIEDSYEPLFSRSRDETTLVQRYVVTADQELKAHW
ncbi:hypothetical protein PC129_g13856 [Phytophthora cactorum]|uniref:Integrase catalytic domain-containing protein n=2 Tax=Phytophthora cactorum TaxID=29920 RepID=A0A8T1HS21_9STRA|nr:hypothetical protein PC129_g13856 [Phytophthora cactorum]